MNISRALLPAALAGALLITGCSVGGGTASTDAAGNDCLAAGDASSALEVSGGFGVDAKIDSQTPIKATSIERSVLKEGKGKVAEADQTLKVTMVTFNGADGSALQQATEGEIPLADVQDIEWAYEGLRCALPGEETAVVVPFEDYFGVGVDPMDIGVEGITKEDSLVVLIRTNEIIDSVLEGAAACEDLDKRDKKFPEVDLNDGSSEPTITIPECMEAPAELELKVLEEGDGATVKDGEEIMTNYVGVDWNGAVRFDGNWSETGIAFSTAEGRLVEGFRQAMIGQKIGSVILVTMPSELGYNDGMTRTFVLELVEKA